MMLAPVKQTMPAISMEYQRALGTVTAAGGWAPPEGHRGQRRGGEGEGHQEGDSEQGRTKGEFISVLRTVSVPTSVCLARLWKVLEGGGTIVHDLSLRGLSTPSLMVGVPVSLLHSPNPTCIPQRLRENTLEGTLGRSWPTVLTPPA